MRTIADCIHAMTNCYRVGTPGNMHHAINEHVVRDTIAHLNRVAELEGECFKLAAGVCKHRGGDDHGNPLCLKTNQPI